MWLRNAVVALLLLATPAWADRLVWDANPASEQVTGYRVHHGLVSGQYDTTVDVGPVTEWPLPESLRGRYLAVTAYSAGGESGYSAEVLWATPPAAATDVRVSWTEEFVMAAAIRSSNSVSSGSRTNTTITAPSGIQNGDLLLALISVGNTSSPAVTPPTGFTEVTTVWPMVYSSTDPWEVKVRAYQKVASSESGNYTFSHSTAYTEAVMFAISGADTTTPVSPNPTATLYTSGIANGIFTAPGLTTPRDGSVVVFAAGAWDGIGPTTAPTGTTPTFTEYYDGGSGGVFYVAAGVLTTAGATGDKSITSPDSAHARAAAGLLCIQASAGGGATSILRQMMMNH